MDSNKQSQATLDLCQLSIQPHTPYRFSKNLINADGSRHFCHWDFIHIPNEVLSMNTQDTFKFAQTHEWADLESDGLVWVGISNHAQEALGDVMFFQAPKPGQQVKQGEAIAVIESVKAASDIHAPVSGEIVAINEAVDSSPEIINENPYGVWLFKIKPSSESSLALELDQLMSLEKYSATAGA